MSIYFNDDHTEYVINQRVNLDKYHEPDARELYDWIEEKAYNLLLQNNGASKKTLSIIDKYQGIV